MFEMDPKPYDSSLSVKHVKHLLENGKKPSHLNKKLLINVIARPFDRWDTNNLTHVYPTSYVFIGFNLYLHWKSLPSDKLQIAYNDIVSGSEIFNSVYSRLGKVYKAKTMLGSTYKDKDFKFMVGIKGAKAFLPIPAELPRATKIKSQFLNCVTQTEAEICLKGVFRCITNIKLVARKAIFAHEELLSEYLVQSHPINLGTAMAILKKHNECCASYCAKSDKTPAVLYTYEQRLDKCVRILKTLTISPKMFRVVMQEIGVDIYKYTRNPKAEINCVINENHCNKVADPVKSFLEDFTNTLKNKEYPQHIRSKDNPLKLYKNLSYIDFVATELVSDLANVSI